MSKKEGAGKVKSKASTIKARKRKENILVFSAHSDDFVLGAGGTINEYAKKGNKVTAIIFSYGETGLPWLKEKFARKIRTDETLAACKLLNCKVVFFDLREGQFWKGYKEKKLHRKIISIIKRKKPAKIFLHSSEDPHPDHKAVNKIILDVFEKIEKSVEHKPELYIYSVWNPVSFKTQYPALYVNVSRSFSTKLRALKKYRSQKVHVAYPFVLLMYRAITEGIKIRKRFAEKFFRIK